MVVETFIEFFSRFFYSSLVPVAFAASLVILGYLLGSIVKIIIVKFLERPRINDWLEEQNISTSVGGHTIATILGNIVQWSIVALFLSEVTSFFKLRVISGLLSYISTTLIWGILLAVVIFVAGLIIGRYVRNLIEATNNRFKRLFSIGIEAVIVYMSLIMALSVIKGANQKPIIPVDILHQTFLIAFTGLVLTISLALGISFGFAMKEEAKTFLKELTHKK